MQVNWNAQVLSGLEQYPVFPIVQILAMNMGIDLTSFESEFPHRALEFFCRALGISVGERGQSSESVRVSPNCGGKFIVALPCQSSAGGQVKLFDARPRHAENL